MSGNRIDELECMERNIEPSIEPSIEPDPPTPKVLNAGTIVHDALGRARISHLQGAILMENKWKEYHRHKVAPTRYCDHGCGRVISANKTTCLACSITKNED